MKGFLFSLVFCGGMVCQAEQYVMPVAYRIYIDIHPAVFEKASRSKPLVIQNNAQAERFILRHATSAQSKHVDFENQKILIFAWEGSRGENITLQRGEQEAKTITFTFTPALTQKRPQEHMVAYVLSKEVTWEMK